MRTDGRPQGRKGDCCEGSRKGHHTGTHTPENPKENTYIISIFPSGDKHGIAAADISTGQFMVFETRENIEDEVNRIEPKEILMPSSLKDSIHYGQALSGYYLSSLEDWLYDYAEAYNTLLTHFRSLRSKATGVKALPLQFQPQGPSYTTWKAPGRDFLPSKK